MEKLDQDLDSVSPVAGLQDGSLRLLPAVDVVLRQPPIQTFLSKYSRELITGLVREALDNWRGVLAQPAGAENPPKQYFDRDTIRQKVVEEAIRLIELKTRVSLRSVINATGVILHTNLGRARLSDSAQTALQQIGSNYSNLELDLLDGSRGSRYQHTDELLQMLTGAEASLVVNNNAAAVLLVLNTLAREREVIVSRGQLVEIGGAFRVPDVMTQSGAVLREVGTTNKTYPTDYARAINDKTAILLKVHTSNYRIIGFTQETSLAELVKLGQASGLPVVEDLGSGLLIDLKPWGLPAEPVVGDSIRAGVDVVTFSGDKLLGGPQAGIIVGKKRYIDKMKQNPLNRAFRIDKLTLAALEITLREYLDPKQALLSIPTLRMITASQEELQAKAGQIAAGLTELIGEKLMVSVVCGKSTVGGGSMPGEELPTWLVRVKPSGISAAALAERLRRQPVPVLVRIQDEAILLDARTIADAEGDLLLAAFQSALADQECRSEGVHEGETHL